MSHENHITYLEFSAIDLQLTKNFYGAVFGWTFQDWSPEYVSFHGAGVEGGFDASGERTPCTGTLVIISTNNLEQKLSDVTTAGGNITKGIFSFPGGRRFEFTDPSGNGLAVWQTENNPT